MELEFCKGCMDRNFYNAASSNFGFSSQFPPFGIVFITNQMPEILRARYCHIKYVLSDCLYYIIKILKIKSFHNYLQCISAYPFLCIKVNTNVAFLTAFETQYGQFGDFTCSFMYLQPRMEFRMGKTAEEIGIKRTKDGQRNEYFV